MNTERSPFWVPPYVTTGQTSLKHKLDKWEVDSAKVLVTSALRSQPAGASVQLAAPAEVSLRQRRHNRRRTIMLRLPS